MVCSLVRSGACAMIFALLIFWTQASAEFTPIAGWDRQLFPSYLVATATLRLPADAEGWDEAENEVADEGEADEGDEWSESDAGDDDGEAPDEESEESEEEEEVDESADDEEDDEEDDAEDAGDQDGVQVIGDSQGLLGVKIESPGDDVTVTVTITGDAILEESTITCTLASEGVQYAIFPKIKYDYDALACNKQSKPVSVTFSVQVDDEDEEEQTVTVTLRSVNDCPYAIVYDDGSASDVSFMFAAYVNEQHPFADKMLREALDVGVVDSFTGYQSGDEAEVFRQVYALWHALSERDVRYSNITTSAAESDAVHSQHVRLIDESINNSQANCVDGSVLLASLLRKIDIEPVLVMVPGHCYLAFYLDEARERLVGLETTLVGSPGADDGEAEIEGVEDIVDSDWSKAPSWATFCEAIAYGSENLRENAAKFEAEDDADYQLIGIAAARKLGILPIAFDEADDFESTPSDDE